ncbi:MAG: DUF502 domain-containing protein [Candidatus Omnitrophica bacterium]|nr:DUF502 domain-containing protein [Candidatus Omnitrophota bacterium]MCM8827436.1 DUF502 domain-containing protein [Candidatus Omnitrophota bacterium]
MLDNKEVPKSKSNLLLRMRKYFFTGIATIFPIFITVYTILIVFKFADSLLGRYINSFLKDKYGIVIPGLGLIVTLIIIITFGLLSHVFIVKKLFVIIEKIFLRLPFVAYIYPAAKQLSDFLFDKVEKEKFKKVAIVEYPYNNCYALGFVTNEEMEDFNNKTGKELVSVLIPVPPSPFTGPIALLPKEKVKMLDITIEQAIKFVVSGGIVYPFDKKEQL